MSNWVASSYALGLQMLVISCGCFDALRDLGTKFAASGDEWRHLTGCENFENVMTGWVSRNREMGIYFSTSSP